MNARRLPTRARAISAIVIAGLLASACAVEARTPTTVGVIESKVSQPSSDEFVLRNGQRITIERRDRCAGQGLNEGALLIYGEDDEGPWCYHGAGGGGSEYLIGDAAYVEGDWMIFASHRLRLPLAPNFDDGGDSDRSWMGRGGTTFVLDENGRVLRPGP